MRLQDIQPSILFENINNPQVIRQQVKKIFPNRQLTDQRIKKSCSIKCRDNKVCHKRCLYDSWHKVQSALENIRTSLDVNDPNWKSLNSDLVDKVQYCEYKIYHLMNSMPASIYGEK